jgi:pimeloyl-ACP methyl ester carboxylesterase
VSTEELFIEDLNAEVDGTRVILVHGAPDRSRNFRRVVDELRLETPLTLYDRRGYGRSAAAVSGGGGFPVHALDLLEIIGDRPAIVVAQSAGASVALLASTMRPQSFVTLGIWEPPMVAYEWWVGPAEMERLMHWVRYDDHRQCVEDQNRLILGDGVWESLSAETKEMLRADGEAFWLDMDSQRVQHFQPEEVTVPVFAGFGTFQRESYFPVAYRRLIDRLGARSHCYEGASHAAHITHSRDWADFARRTIAIAVAEHGAVVRFAR